MKTSLERTGNLQFDNNNNTNVTYTVYKSQDFFPWQYSWIKTFYIYISFISEGIGFIMKPNYSNAWKSGFKWRKQSKHLKSEKSFHPINFRFLLPVSIILDKLLHFACFKRIPLHLGRKILVKSLAIHWYWTPCKE